MTAPARRLRLIDYIRERRVSLAGVALLLIVASDRWGFFGPAPVWYWLLTVAVLVAAAEADLRLQLKTYPDLAPAIDGVHVTTTLEDRP